MCKQKIIIKKHANMKHAVKKKPEDGTINTHLLIEINKTIVNYNFNMAQKKKQSTLTVNMIKNQEDNTSHTEKKKAKKQLEAESLT